MNTPQIFEHEYFGSVRTVMINGEPHFAGKDIAIALGYTNPSKAVRDHCKGGPTVHPFETSGGTQSLRVITEEDVYLLGMSSHLPAAQKFREWLASVAAELRKTGVVDIRNEKQVIDLDDPENVLQLAHSLSVKLVESNQIIKEQADQLEETVPKAEVYNEIVTSEELHTLTVLAKILEVQPRLFINRLREQGFLHKKPTGEHKNINLPVQRYERAGFFKVKLKPYLHPHTGETMYSPQTFVTSKGIAYFEKLIIDEKLYVDDIRV